MVTKKKISVEEVMQSIDDEIDMWKEDRKTVENLARIDALEKLKVKLKFITGSF